MERNRISRRTFAGAIGLGSATTLCGVNADDASSGLYSFEELTDHDPGRRSFAYWILVERKPLPGEHLEAKSLKRWMSYHYDVEEQASSVTSFCTRSALQPEFVRLFAPVTLAEHWTPFSEAQKLLGKPVKSGCGADSYFCPAFGIWKPKDLASQLPDNDCAHTKHFTFLLRLACSLALTENGRLIIVGAPGWSYRHWKQESQLMAPNVARLMHKAGYLYTERAAL